MSSECESVQLTAGAAWRRTMLTVLCCLGLAAAPVLAQDAPPDEAKAAKEALAAQQEALAEQDPSLLPAAGEEIVVTARKREENVQEVPVAVTVKTGEALEDSAAADLSELQGEVPNLTVYSGRNQSTTLTAFMRGIGQADPLWGVDPGVGLYLDDVYIARPQGALLDVFDVQRIEVLRGPQGTLYGKNTIGGAIKYVSSELPDHTTGRISIGLGSYDNQDVRAAIGGAAAGGRLRAKLAFASLRHEGYGENLFLRREVSDRDTMAYRAAVEWRPSERGRWQLAYDRTEDDAEPKGHTRLQANFLCPVFLAAAACPPEAEIFDTRSGLAPKNGTTSSGYSLTWSQELDEAWLFKSISAYRESDTENNIDFDTTPARIVDVATNYFDEQLSQELQLVYQGGGSFDGVVGAYYFDGQAGGLVKNVFINGLPIAGVPQFGTTDGTTDTTSLALFGDGSWRLTPGWNLNFGLRATQEKKHGRAFNANYTNDTFSVVHTVVADYDREETFDSLAPKLGLDYQLSDDVMTYLTVSRGFKSGGFNVRAQSVRFPESAEPFDDEILDVAEVGLKTVLLDRNLVLNTAVFYGEYKDIQVSTFTAFDADGDGVEDAFFGNFLNAGNATMKGAELEYDWTASGWFGLSGQVSWLDLEPDELLDENNDGFVDTQVITNAPELTAALRANLRFPAFRGVLTGSAGVAYRDESVLTNEGGSFAGRAVRPIVQDSYSLVDAWVSWLSPGAGWRFGVSGKNLTDEEYLTNGYNIPALGILQGAYGAPRTVIASIEYRFF